MENRLKPLRSTDELAGSRGGLQKQWPLGAPENESLLWDYIQKVNYSVQDFNETIEREGSFKRQDVVFLIALAAWINEAAREIDGCYREEVRSSFSFSNQQALDKYYNFFRAVRTFVMAHPLKTDEHPDFGLGGDYICIDIRGKKGLLDWHKGDLRRLSPDGMKSVSSIPETDIVLYAYSKEAGVRFFHYIGLDLCDIRDFAALNIEKLYEFDRCLGRLKKRDFDK